MLVPSTVVPEERPATHPLRLSSLQQSLLAEVWIEMAKLKEYSPQLPDASLRAFRKLETALTKFQQDCEALLEPWLDNAIDDSLYSMDNQNLFNGNGMEAIVDILSALYGEFTAEKDGEAPKDRIQRIYGAGQNAKRKVDEALVDHPGFAGVEKASTGFVTDTASDGRETVKSGGTLKSLSMRESCAMF